MTMRLQSLCLAGMLVLSSTFMACGDDETKPATDAATDTVEPGDTTEPSDTTEPADTTEPSDTTEPADTTEPGDTTEPTDTSEPTACDLHCPGIVEAGCSNSPPNLEACKVVCAGLAAPPCGDFFGAVATCMGETTDWVCAPVPGGEEGETTFAPSKAECMEPFMGFVKCAAVAEPCGDYCEGMETICTGDNAVDFGEMGCFKTCVGYEIGAEGDTAGNSLACRLYHLNVAGQEAPEMHCPHASPEGGGVCVDAEPTACDTYCGLMEANCTGDNAVDFGADGCLAACGMWAEGTEGDTDGDSVQCRIYHATVAGEMDPETHCPHASPEGGGVCVAAE